LVKLGRLTLLNAGDGSSGSWQFLTLGSQFRTNPASDVVALAASAGGLRAISRILSDLPADLPAAILVVQHLDPRHVSYMAQILARQTELGVKQAATHDEISCGTVYVAPPNRHLLVNACHRIELSDAELVHFVRPSADLLFDSVAATFREHAIGVVLSGSGVDGSIGVKAIKQMHGTVLVQKSAEFDGMPNAAIQSGSADQLLDLKDIPDAIMTLLALHQAS
jgi:two-component system chemotaxis response regulator CheB